MSTTKERPILFSGAMVRALLDGSKTQTRRVVKPQPASDQGMVNAAYCGDRNLWLRDGPCDSSDPAKEWRCPYGQPGDRLWVREAFRFPASLDRHSPAVVGEMAVDAGYRTPWAPTHFEADGATRGEWLGFETPPTVSVPGKLRPSMFMPRWASRITLEITSVSVERLQDISEADALAEGSLDWAAKQNTPVRDLPEARLVYRQLWEQINGPGSWDVNPWVWVVSFKKVTP